MMDPNNWMLYLLASSLTGSPLLGLLVVFAAGWAAEGWWRGRLWKPWVVFDQWMRIRQLRALVATNPHDMTARADLGRLLIERKRPAEARKHLEVVFEKLPKLALPAYHLGVCRLAAGDWEGGKAAIDRALANRPDVEYGAPWLALANFQLDAGKPAEALPFYEKAVEVHSSSAEAYYRMGRCQLALGDAAAAKAAFDEAIAVWDGAPRFKAAQERGWALRAWWWKRKVPAGSARKAA